MIAVCSCSWHHSAQREAAIDLLGICLEAGFFPGLTQKRLQLFGARRAGTEQRIDYKQ